MTQFSPKISNFLTQVGADRQTQVSIVSESSCQPGDVLFFRYELGTGVGSRRMRLFLLVRPVFRNASTGNKLMTGFTLPLEHDFTFDSLKGLYKMGKVKMEQGLEIYKTIEKAEHKNKVLEELLNVVVPPDSYRTYIVSKIYGSLNRISRTPEEELG